MPKFLSLLTNGQGMDLIIIKLLMKTNTFGLIGYKRVSSLSTFGLKKVNKMFDYLIYGYHEIKTIVYDNEISKAAFNIFKNRTGSMGQTGPSIDQTTLRFGSN